MLSASNGMVYPFCIYNSGPGYREQVEKEFSVPFDLKAADRARRRGL